MSVLTGGIKLSVAPDLTGLVLEKLIQKGILDCWIEIIYLVISNREFNSGLFFVHGFYFLSILFGHAHEYTPHIFFTLSY